MSKVETTYALNDKVTATLKNITRAMDQAIKAMEQMDGQTKKQEDALNGARKSIDAAQKAVNSMSFAQEEAKKSTDNATRSIKLNRDQIERMRVTAEKAARAPDQLSKAHKDLIMSVRRSDESMSAFGRTLGKGTWTVAAAGLRDTGDAAKKAKDEQDKLNESVSNGVKKWKEMAAGAVAALGVFKMVQSSISGLSGMLAKGFEFIEFRQASEAAFKVFLGDAEKAKEYMDSMYALALKTPFAFPDLLTAGRNMIAFGVEADNTFRVITAIGDAVAGIGGGAAELNSMADIFGQIQSQGKVTLMETNRLSQYGINAVQMMADATGKSTAQIQKDISAGLIDSATAFEHIIGGMEKQFGGLMEGVKDTLRGSLDSFRSAQRNVGTALLNDMVEPITKTVQVLTQMLNALPKYLGPVAAVIKPLIAQFNALFEDGRADRFFSTIAVGLWLVVAVLSEVGQFAMWVAGIFFDYWAFFEPIILFAAVALGIYLGRLILYHGWVLAVRVATAAWAFAQWVVNVAMLAFPGSWILLAFVAVLVLVVYMLIVWSDVTIAAIGIVVGAFSFLGAFIINLFILVGNIALAVAEIVVNAWNIAVYMIKMFFIGLGTVFLFVIDGILNTGIAAAEIVANAWGSASYNIQLAFYKMRDMILSIMEAVANGVEGVINGALLKISDLVNAGIKGLNIIIKKANKVPGVNIGEIGEVSFSVGSSASSAFKAARGGSAPVRPDKVSFDRTNLAGNFLESVNAPASPDSVQFGRFDYVDMGQAFKDGQELGKGWGESLSGGLTGLLDNVGGLVSKLKDGPPGMDIGDLPEGVDFAGPAADAAGAGAGPAGKGGAGPAGKGGTGKGGAGKGGKGGKSKSPAGSKITGGKLDSVGKIEDDVDISDETIKLLQEWSDMKNIQNYVTLQPNIVFDGTVVREEADLDKIYGMIETQLADDIEKSAKGLYT